MQFACNWSIALKALLEKQAIDVDYIKSGAFGSFDEQYAAMRSLKPILVHGLGYHENTGMADMNVIDFVTANRVIGQCCSPHYGLHLGIRKADMSLQMTDSDIYERMCRQIHFFKKNIKVPLLLENSPDTPNDRLEFDLYPYNSPEQVSKIIMDNDVGLLLDITHAKLTAKFRNLNIYDYLGAFPLKRVKEIHTNGSGFDSEGFPKDTHQVMEDEDYALLEWVLGRTNPEIVTIEYIGAEAEEYEAVLSSTEYQIKEIRKIVGGH